VLLPLHFYFNFEFITQTLISVNYLAKKICSASNRKKAKINIGIVLSFSQ